ncbi:MAG: transporter [Calditrichaeota bacterium]|nr:MAG: transporter [Calditrichota bacterium]MBL1207212.1 transporter [Calditrichota bacterium]NOG47045.1 hypothetical protein [Calditrichota bacterium]
MNKTVNQFLIMICFFFSQNLLTQGPPINTETPIMLGLQGSGVRSFAKIIHKSVDDESKNYPKVTAIVVPLVIPVNLFNDKFQAGFILPYMNISLKLNGNKNKTSGMGDGQIFVKYLLFQKDAKNETFRIAAKTNIKFANGDATLQPALGSGSTDIVFSTIAGWIKHRVGIYLEAKYALTGSYKSREFGDTFFYNLAFGYRLLPRIYNQYPMDQVNIFLELNGLIKYKDEVSGNAINDTGGSSLFLSPGLQFVVGSRWLVESSFQYPIINSWDSFQLVEDWKASFGFRFLFDI